MRFVATFIQMQIAMIASFLTMHSLQGLRYTEITGSETVLESSSDNEMTPESSEIESIQEISVAEFVDESVTDPETEMVPSIYDSLSAKKKKPGKYGDVTSMFKKRTVVPVVSEPNKTEFNGKKADLFAVLNGNRKPKETVIERVTETEKITELEKKIYESKKSVNVKDFLSTKAPRNPSLKVTLNVNKEALAFYKQFENPLKTRGTSRYVAQKYPVTLNVSGDKLRPFEVKKSNANSVFAMMMKEAASESIKLTPIQKLKELAPPILSHEDFHIGVETLEHTDAFLSSLTSRQRSSVDLASESLEFSGSLEEYLSKTSETREFITSTYSLSMQEAQAKFASRCSGSPFHHLHKLLFTPHIQSSWPQLFEPDRTEDLLLSEDNRTVLKEWIEKSFDKLMAESFKGQRKLKKKPKKTGLEAFIVDDFDQDESSDFMPLLIIQGNTGTGKSAAVYTSMKDINGYVHEINASQQRSRRDLSGILKELCTTQLIHQQGEDGFQKGLVLLEDCDILFEQDRTFWAVVSEILEISRRPIVLTVTDESVIPRQLYDRALEDGRVLDFNNNRLLKKELFKDYIWGCCFTQGYDINDRTLDGLLAQQTDYKTDMFDIRHFLVSCQMMCRSNPRPVFGQDMVNLVKIETVEAPQKNDTTLAEISQQLDLISATDTIETTAPTQIDQLEVDNEFIDLYYIDQSKNLRQPLMPHEQSVTNDILTIAKWSQKQTIPESQNSNLFRSYVNDYVGSRSKPMPGILQGLGPRSTRTSSADQIYEFWKPDPVGIPDGSICIHLPPSAFVTQFAPYVRHWCLLQLGLDKLDKEAEVRTKSVVSWREFQQKGMIPLRTHKYGNYGL